MRDAFGGVFMIRLFLVFIVIYVAFAAVSLNYAKAFRVKNAVISFIEENEIIDLTSLNGDENNNSKLAELNEILTNTSYNKTCESFGLPDDLLYMDNMPIGRCYKGIFIMINNKERIQGTNSANIVYTVATYADWNVGVLNKILALAGRQENSDQPINGKWSVSGEAKVVARDVYN